MNEYFDEFFDDFPKTPDHVALDAYEELKKFFEDNANKVFYGRQLEIIFENKYFHWITNRVIRDLARNNLIISQKRDLKNGGHIILYWHKSFRYNRREANNVIDIVEEFSKDDVGYAIGSYCELLVLEGFAKFEYVLKGRNSNEFNGNKWRGSQHDLDLIYQKDEITYGMEIKNTLGYMDKDELDIKISVCKELGIKPVFVARMLPRIWINEIINQGGFALILKYQLFPPYVYHI
ncbi:MAG: hypothetical protein JWO92_2006 [Chitinophagaceae bacterium]|nr:hypothetical protein [Chitinophagaceae bacterium]